MTVDTTGVGEGDAGVWRTLRCMHPIRPGTRITITYDVAWERLRRENLAWNRRQRGDVPRVRTDATSGAGR